MELLLIGTTALLAAGLTLFSGFGLGTILMPVFALFFPLPLAIAATAVVHFVNNFFKFGLMARQSDWRVVMYFSVPAAISAIAGAWVLTIFDELPVLTHYAIGTSEFDITVIGLIIGVLIIIFALLELSKKLQELALPPRWLPLGGVLSGFFGGLSGNQGALRSAFLIKSGLSKEAFVATSAVSAVIVDAVRLTVYGFALLKNQFDRSETVFLPLIVAIIAAFIGSLLGKKLLPKVTLRAVQLIVAATMLVIGMGITLGLL